MKNRFLFIIVAVACGSYFGYKLTGKPLMAILAVALVVIAGIYTFIYDLIHHSFPWTKTGAAKRAEEKLRIEKAKAKEARINARINARTNKKEK